MKGSAKAPGTCGELVQGMLEDINFLVTCPINCYSEVSVSLTNKDYIFINDSKKHKVLNSVTKTMLYITNKIHGACINVNSQLPISKGMASSTADISAACLATGRALNYELSPQEIAKIALSIEPSDGIFFPGIAAFDHVEGKFYRHLGNALNLNLLVYDLGGEVDTVLFNRRPDLREKNRLKEPQIRKALELVEKGFLNKDPGLVAQGSTISALANQSILSKPSLEVLLDLVISKGALGLNIAHSGTLIGIIIEEEKVDWESLLITIAKQNLNLKYIGDYKLVDGGVQYEETKEATMWDKSVSMVAT